jgi:hypothetical protein
VRQQQAPKQGEAVRRQQRPKQARGSAAGAGAKTGQAGQAGAHLGAPGQIEVKTGQAGQAGAHLGAPGQIEVKRLDPHIIFIIPSKGDLLGDLGVVDEAVPPPPRQLHKGPERAHALHAGPQDGTHGGSALGPGLLPPLPGPFPRQSAGRMPLRGSVGREGTAKVATWEWGHERLPPKASGRGRKKMKHPKRCDQEAGRTMTPHPASLPPVRGGGEG